MTHDQYMIALAAAAGAAGSYCWGFFMGCIYTRRSQGDEAA